MMDEPTEYQPETMRHCKSFMKSVLKEGALNTKTKEIITIGTTITARCKYCIAIHLEKALNAGTVKENIF